jgi:UPF0716 protein FxsA
VLVGGTLLLTPGFVSDIAGFVCVLPFTRPAVRTALTRFLTRRFLSVPSAPGYTSRREPAQPQAQTRQRPGPDQVVQGEVVD